MLVAKIPIALKYVGHSGIAQPLSPLAFPAEVDLARAPKGEGTGFRALMATALRDGDSAALDELLAIAKRTTVDTA